MSHWEEEGLLGGEKLVKRSAYHKNLLTENGFHQNECKGHFFRKHYTVHSKGKQYILEKKPFPAGV